MVCRYVYITSVTVSDRGALPQAPLFLHPSGNSHVPGEGMMLFIARDSGRQCVLVYMQLA